MRGWIEGWPGRFLLCILLSAVVVGCQKAEMPVESAPPEEAPTAATTTSTTCTRSPAWPMGADIRP